ncbi:MAG: hypothetical protein R3B84_04440 [Zavarzinella sp.]
MSSLPPELATRLLVLCTQMQLRNSRRAGLQAILGVFLFAALCVGCDAFFPLPQAVRWVLLLSWAAWSIFLVRRWWKIKFQPVDPLQIAAQAEVLFPRLSERMLTCVELATESEQAHGSPEIIAALQRETTVRAQKLDLEQTIPTMFPRWQVLAAFGLLLLLLTGIIFQGNPAQQVRRFFLPSYQPTPKIQYQLVVTSGNPTADLGETVTFTGYAQLTADEGTLPELVYLETQQNGISTVYPMNRGNDGVWYFQLENVAEDLDYRLTTHVADSEIHHVTVVEPVRMRTAKTSITPPSYVDAPEQVGIAGLPEITAWQYSNIAWELQFQPKPVRVQVAFKPTKEHPGSIPVKLADLIPDENAQVQLRWLATVSGEMVFTAHTTDGRQISFPPQKIHLMVDQPPVIADVQGLQQNKMRVRPGEQIRISAQVTDDVALTAISLDYRINQDSVQHLPWNVPAGKLSSTMNPQMDFTIPLNLKLGDSVYFRIVATDNREFPQQKLSPQTTYHPDKNLWFELTIDPEARALAEQQILQLRDQLHEKIKAVLEQVKSTTRGVNRFRAETSSDRVLPEKEKSALDQLSTDSHAAANDLTAIARDSANQPTLGKLQQEAEAIAQEHLNPAGEELTLAKQPANSITRINKVRGAEDHLDRSIVRLEKLLELNEKVARDRLDLAKVDELAKKQQQLADRAKDLNPANQDDIATQQAKLRAQLQQLAEQSETIRNALKSMQVQQSKELAAKAEQLAAELEELSRAIDESQQVARQEKLKDIQKRQQDLAMRAAELAKQSAEVAQGTQIAPLDSQEMANASDKLRDGDANASLIQQEKAAMELDRLSQELRAATAGNENGREAARQLARLQTQLAREIEEKLAAKPTQEAVDLLQKKQKAILNGMQELKLPTQPAQIAGKQTEKLIQDAEKALKDAPGSAGKIAADAARKLQELAELLPNKTERLAQARRDVAALAKTQAGIKAKVDQLQQHLQTQPNNQADAQTLDELRRLSKQQAEIAGKLNDFDLPGQVQRQQQLVQQMNQAAGELLDSPTRGATNSQNQVGRSLERLQQALEGKVPDDEQVDLLTKKQRKVAEQAQRPEVKQDQQLQNKLLQEQAEINQQLEKLHLPEVPASKADAANATRSAEKTASQGQWEQFPAATEQAVEKLETLRQQLNQQETASETLERLARLQESGASELQKKQDRAVVEQSRKQSEAVRQELSQVPQLQALPELETLERALKKAAEPGTAPEVAQAQQESARMLQEAAEKLSRTGQEQSPATPPTAEEVDQLAKKQEKLAKETEKELGEAAKIADPQQRQQATDRARTKAKEQQQELAKELEAGYGQDSPEEFQQAKAGMSQAQEQLQQGKDGAALDQMKGAAKSLQKLAEIRSQVEARRNNMTGANPTEAAAKAAEMAAEQRKLQRETLQAGREMDQQPPRTDNPIGKILQEQAALAKEVGQFADAMRGRLGDQAPTSKQSASAAASAKKAAAQLENGNVRPGRTAGEEVARTLDEVRQAMPQSNAGKEAAELAQRQKSLNEKMAKLEYDLGALQAQQMARQQSLREQAKELADEMAKLPANPSAEQMQRAVEAMQSGDNQNPRGDQEKRNQAAENLRQAAKSMPRLQPDPASPPAQAGQDFQRAQNQMQQAQQNLQRGELDQVAQQMQQAADALQKSTQQLSNRFSSGNQQGNQPQNAPRQLGTIPLDPKLLGDAAKEHQGKRWGELPGEIQTKIIQDMKARYGEDYARNIKLYFEQLSERK